MTAAQVKRVRRRMKHDKRYKATLASVKAPLARKK